MSKKLKYRVYTGQEVEDSNDNVVYFRLEQYEYSGTVTLIACDREGSKLPSGNILSIGPGDHMYRYMDVNEGIGLPLDEFGQIEIE